MPAELKLSDDVDLASLVKAKLLSPVPLSFYEASGSDLAQTYDLHSSLAQTQWAEQINSYGSVEINLVMTLSIWLLSLPSSFHCCLVATQNGHKYIAAQVFKWYRGVCWGAHDREGKPEAPETAADAIAGDSGGVKLTCAPGNVADTLQVQARPADVSADVATDVSADVAVRRENDATAAVTPVKDIGAPLESAAAERKSEGVEDALVAGTTGEAVLVGVEGTQIAELSLSLERKLLSRM